MNSIKISEWKYEIQADKIGVLITNALKATLDEKSVNDSNNDPGKDHYSLSQNWVKNFARRLEANYNDKNDIKAFYRDENSKEFLYDITVGECKDFLTKRSKEPSKYVSKSIWQIESEFEKNATAIAYDFSKLFSGNAPFKMMVGPLREEEDNEGSTYFMDKMKKMCNNISDDESWYFLLITHPGNWKKGKDMIWRLYKWNGKDWGKTIKKDKWKIDG